MSERITAEQKLAQKQKREAAYRAAHPERMREYRRKWAKRNIVALRASRAAWQKRNREKRTASQAVTNAVRDGRLNKPSRCEVCMKPRARICGHHEDYSRPLEVLWVCDACHKIIHRLKAKP